MIVTKKLLSCFGISSVPSSTYSSLKSLVTTSEAFMSWMPGSKPVSPSLLLKVLLMVLSQRNTGTHKVYCMTTQWLFCWSSSGKKHSPVLAFHFVKTADFVGSHEKRDGSVSWILASCLALYGGFTKHWPRLRNSDIQSPKQKGKAVQLNKLQKLWY